MSCTVLLAEILQVESGILVLGAPTIYVTHAFVGRVAEILTPLGDQRVQIDRSAFLFDV